MYANRGVHIGSRRSIPGSKAKCLTENAYYAVNLARLNGDFVLTQAESHGSVRQI